MALPLGAFILLDLVGAALAAAVAAFFAASWRRSGEGLHLLFAVGFVLLAVGIASTSTSQFDLQRPAEAWDALRIAGHTGAALVFAFAYLSARRHGAARPWIVLGWTTAGLGGLLVGLYWLIPPAWDLPGLRPAFSSAHALQFLLYMACVGMSTSGYRRRPTLDNALVPMAFLAWTFSKYTWLLIDLTGQDAIIPLIFAWRFGALGLLLLALALPPTRAREGSPAPA